MLGIFATSTARTPIECSCTKVSSSWSLCRITGTLLLFAAGCIHHEDASGGAGEVEREVPVPGRYLDAKEPEGHGLVTTLGSEGTPLPEDAAVQEANRFYDALGRPQASTPQLVSLAEASTAPLTFAQWRETFGFSERRPNESLEAYRERTGIVIYYNSNELGLGRELGCSQFVDGYIDGVAQLGEACFVSNYGTGWQQGQQALEMAIDGIHKKNTVCITYRPMLKPGGQDGYEVQFYVYNSEGERLPWAQLDTMGPRPVPQVCTGCHGGIYDESVHLVRYARFLPAYPDLLVFGADDDTPSTVTLAAQQQALRMVNAAAMRSPLTPLQRDDLAHAYPLGVDTPGEVFHEGWIPEGWRQTPPLEPVASAETHSAGGDSTESGSTEAGSTELHREDLYQAVVRPYCITCHAAEERTLDGDEHLTYRLFRDSDAFFAYPMLSSVCNNFHMPNAQPTMQQFWEPTAGGIMVRDANGAPTVYPAPADAFLAAFGANRQTCTAFEDMSDCREQGGDEVCGDLLSNMVCEPESGRCVEDL